jgi:uncharacterized protein
MIVEFSVKNFRSIFDLQTISFAATGLSSSDSNSNVDENNIHIIKKQRLLKTIGIYGANASGKSNMIKALEYFCEAIGDLPSPESRLSKLAQPFLYQDNSENSESFFQIVLIVEGKKYRYGFTVKRNTTINSEEDSSREIITNEWLFGPKKVNQVKYFTRSGLDIDMSSLPGNESIAPLEYEHTLFLTHAASYNKDISAKIRNVIKGFVTTKFNSRIDFYRFHSIRHIENDNLKILFLDFLKSFGLYYKDIYFKNNDDFRKKNRYPLDKLFLTKTSTHDYSTKVTLNMEENESDGTKKLFDLAGLILHAFNIKTTGLIILDEIDSNFHPSLLINLINLFNNPKINKANTQLLFTSHDTNLMDSKIMRRDQFYLAEKNENESTRFYSLADLKGIRNDADFAKHYLAGFYGSLPVLSQFVYDTINQHDGTLAN